MSSKINIALIEKTKGGLKQTIKITNVNTDVPPQKKTLSYSLIIGLTFRKPNANFAYLKVISEAEIKQL